MESRSKVFLLLKESQKSSKQSRRYVAQLQRSESPDVTCHRLTAQLKVINQQYKVLSEIGSGACSKVKLVLHLKERKLYAMKVFNKLLLQKKVNVFSPSTAFFRPLSRRERVSLALGLRGERNGGGKSAGAPEHRQFQGGDVEQRGWEVLYDPSICSEGISTKLKRGGADLLVP